MYNPKSMLKKLKSDVSLNFDLDKIIDKLLNKVFGVVDKSIGTDSEKSGIPGSNKSGVPGITLSTRDVELFQTRNLEVFAMTKEDFEKGLFDNAVFVAKEVPIDEDAEPIIVRFRPRPLLADYQLGTIDRYVLFDIRNKSIIEVSQDDYVAYRSLRYKRSYVISWYIFGKADDYQIGKYVYPGVRNNNIDVLAQAETLIPGITDYFEDKTEYLLESLDDYSGDPEIVNLPEPEDPIPVEQAEELEDLGFGPDTLNLPQLPKIDLDFAEDLAGDFTAADELLGNVSASIEDIIASQDQVTAEQENLLNEQENRLRQLEEDQKKQERKNAFLEIINDMTINEGKWAQNIIEISTKAKNKKKKRRLDQERDEEKAVLLFSSLLNKTKWKDDEGVPYEFTPEEAAEWGNESKVNTRMRLRVNERELYTNWTRDNKKFYGKTVLYTITAAKKSKSEQIPDPTLNYNLLKLKPSEARLALTLLSARDRRRPNLRSIIQNIWKEQKKVYRDKTGKDPDEPTTIRNTVQDRYNEYKRQTEQTGRYSKRPRQRNPIQDTGSVSRNRRRRNAL